MVVKNGDESHGTIVKQVNKSKPSKMDLVRFFKSKTNGIFGKPISPIWINNINISVASHLDLHQKKKQSLPMPSLKKMAQMKFRLKLRKSSKKGHLAIF